MTHKMRLRDASFELIKEGRKSVDIRLFDEKRQCIQRGDEIEYSPLGDPRRTIKVRVLDTHRFKTFEELFNAFDLESLGVEKKEDLAYIYDIYTKDEERAYGAVGIEVRPVEG